nr:glucosyltransferase domain-containing protein [Lachnospiraceae bacterium]
ALILMVFAIGSYQAFICVYLTAVAAFALKKALNKEKWFAFSAEAFVICALAALSYFLINRAIQSFIGSTSYLTENYVGWKSDGILKAGFMAFANVVRVSFAIPIRGEIVYGGIPICVLSVLFIVFALREVIHLKSGKERAVIAFLSVILIMAPFSLYIALGTYRTHGRVLLALSLVGMVEMIFVSKRVLKPWGKRTVAVVFSLLLLLNLVNMNRIYFSAAKAYERDCETADRIVEYIKGVTDPTDKAIVFVGALPEYDDIKPKNVTLGASFFSWDGGANHRLRAFFGLRGLDCLEPGASEIEEALETVKGRKPGSFDGESIIVSDRLIVVYLGEPDDKWYATNLNR